MLWETIQVSNTAIDGEAVRRIASRNPRVLRLLWSGITDVHLRALLAEIPRLQSLDLRGCRSLTNPLSSIACSSARLSCLNVNFARIQTDQCLKYLLVHRETLVELHLAQTDITDKGLNYVLSVCQNLQELDVYNCTAITDKAFEHAGVTCPALRSMDVRGTGVTHTLLTMLNPCVHLHTVDFRDCQKCDLGLWRSSNYPCHYDHR